MKQRAELDSRFLSLLCAACVALPALAWVIYGVRIAVRVPFGRDQGIFQYTAWAVSQGQRLYLDIHDANGPLATWIHLLFQKLGGANEQRFRTLDFAVSIAVFALFGACLPGRLTRVTRIPRLYERAVWAFASSVVLSSGYLLFDWWQSCQRDEFCMWFVIVSVALQLQGQRLTHGRRRFWLGGAGAASVIPWLGKPTFVLFTACQVTALLCESRSRRRSWPFAAGMAGAGLVMLGLLALTADIPAYITANRTFIPDVYRFIGANDLLSLFTFFGDYAIWGMVGSALMVGLIATGYLPKRALAIALLPLAAIVHVAVQRKGFVYHYYPLVACARLQALTGACWLTQLAQKQRRIHSPVAAGALLVSAVVGFRAASDAAASPHLKSAFLLDRRDPASKVGTQEYYSAFQHFDLPLWEQRIVAYYLADHTKPSDRIQVYGMDPWILFLARRLSASPYIYHWDLNMDVALRGGKGAYPNARQRERIAGYAAKNDAALLMDLRASRPPKIIFFDHGGFMSNWDAVEDFRSHCPLSAPWVLRHYREEWRTNMVRIYTLNPPDQPKPAARL